MLHHIALYKFNIDTDTGCDKSMFVHMTHYDVSIISRLAKNI